MGNPFLDQGLLPQFSALEQAAILPALTQLLSENRAAIGNLCQQAQPTWASLAMPLQALDARLSNLWSLVSHLNAVCNTEALRVIYKSALQMLTDYNTELSQHVALYDAWHQLSESPEFASLSAAQQQTVRHQLRDFHLGGVDLPAEQKQSFAILSSELANLSSRFSDHLLDATQGWFYHTQDAQELAGLPESALAAAAEAARQKGLDGYVLTLDFPSYSPVITYGDNRALRERLYQAYVTRASDQGPRAGQEDNSELMQAILARRQALAELLGFGCYAERSLATKMASQPEEVSEFLLRLAEASKPFALREIEAIQTFARARDGLEDLQAWDLGYYAEKLRQQRYDFSPEALRPWFPVDRVVQGLFACVQRLFHIEIELVAAADTWHPDVRLYQVSRDGEVMAWFYLDLYARQGKRGGAWMADCRTRWRDAEGRLWQPVAFLTCNFTPPLGDKPALLTHDEVTTLFHEFGHGLHHMLTKIEVRDVSGINGVAWDAVELPSQFLENWCWQAESMALISGHHATGEPLPQALFDKMLAAKHFNAGLQMLRQIEFALFDLRLHLGYPQKGGPKDATLDILGLLDAVRAEVAVLQPPAYNRFANSFSHIFAGGYAAGYYSYKWAEVLAADAFSRFTERGIFDAGSGKAFLQEILEQGGSRDPMDLFIAFRGRPPQVEALLRQSGMLS